MPTRGEIEDGQLERLNRQGSGLALLREANAFYREKLSKVSLPLPSIGALGELAFTTKDELVVDQAENPPYGRNLTFPASEYVRIHATSGTSGHRLKCLDTVESWGWFTRCWRDIYRAIGIESSDRVFAAFGFGPFVGFWAGYEAAQQLGALCIPGGAMTSAQRLSWLGETEATVVLSTPTYALRLAEVAGEEGIDLASGSVRALVQAGEPGASLPATRARIESAWGARVWDHAGMSEAGPWGYECPERGGLHVLETEFVAEVLRVGGTDPVADGETGELILTNLGRWALPAIRYRTGDLVRLDASECPCGSGFVRFPGGVLGRVDDMIHVRGVNVYPSAVETILREEPGLVEFRVAVRRRREMWELRVEIEVETGPDRDGEARREAVRKRLARALETRLGLRADVELAPPGSLPRYELKARRFHIEREGE